MEDQQTPPTIFPEAFKLLSIPGFWGFVHRQVFQKLENAAFRKLELFPSSGEGGDTY
jgi:hypothetical protein